MITPTTRKKERKKKIKPQENQAYSTSGWCYHQPKKAQYNHEHIQLHRQTFNFQAKPRRNASI